jgi:Flp pilus assembly protein TadD
MCPDEVKILDTMGWVRYKLGYEESALHLIKKALALEPEDAATNYHLGIVLYHAGRINEARERLKKSIDKNEAFIGRDNAITVLNKIT